MFSVCFYTGSSKYIIIHLALDWILMAVDKKIEAKNLEKCFLFIVFYIYNYNIFVLDSNLIEISMSVVARRRISLFHEKCSKLCFR